MMNPAIVMTTEEYNVAYMVNEMLNNDVAFEENGLLVDMILTMPEELLNEVCRIYCGIGLPAFQPEYHQETGGDPHRDNVRANPKLPSGIENCPQNIVCYKLL